MEDIERMENPSELSMSLNNVIVLVDRYKLRTDSQIIEWFYPKEIVFRTLIINKSEDTLIVGATEKNFVEDNIWGRIRVKYKDDVFRLNTRDGCWRLKPNDSTVIAAWNTDLPFFDKILTKKEFNVLINDLLYNADYYYMPVEKDYRYYYRESFENKNYYYCSNKTHFDKNDKIDIFLCFPENNGNNVVYSFDTIGFPLEFVPDSIRVHDPYDGLSW
jgi:hypothetical protein